MFEPKEVKEINEAFDALIREIGSTTSSRQHVQEANVLRSRIEERMPAKERRLVKHGVIDSDEFCAGLGHQIFEQEGAAKFYGADHFNEAFEIAARPWLQLHMLKWVINERTPRSFDHLMLLVWAAFLESDTTRLRGKTQDRTMPLPNRNDVEE